MATKENRTLAFTGTRDDSIEDAYDEWNAAREGDSNDDELDAARSLIEALLDYASITEETADYESCDECDEPATIFWPKLTDPVQLCDSCTHNARRSGWEPGQ